jgi:hypothetical protein
MFLLDKNLSAKTLQQQREEEKNIKFSKWVSFFLSALPHFTYWSQTNGFV